MHLMFWIGWAQTDVEWGWIPLLLQIKTEALDRQGTFLVVVGWPPRQYISSYSRWTLWRGESTHKSPPVEGAALSSQEKFWFFCPIRHWASGNHCAMGSFSNPQGEVSSPRGEDFSRDRGQQGRDGERKDIRELLSWARSYLSFWESRSWWCCWCGDTASVTRLLSESDTKVGS